MKEQPNLQKEEAKKMMLSAETMLGWRMTGEKKKTQKLSR